MSDDGYNVSLEIQNVVVGGAVIFQRIGLPGVVIDKIHDVVAPGLAYHLTVLGDVVVGYAAHCCAGKLPLGAAGELDLRHHIYTFPMNFNLVKNVSTPSHIK